MLAAPQTIDEMTLNITDEIFVRAPLDVTFAELLDQLGPSNQGVENSPMPMKLEDWPGGRWFRDLDNGNGHFWGHVQAIKRPTLLEISGPLFMSYPVVSNVQYRLSEKDGGTLIQFRHSAFGLIDESHRKGVATGWKAVHERVRTRAEAERPRHASAK